MRHPGPKNSRIDTELFTRDYLPAAFAPEVLEANQRSLEDQLASLRAEAMKTLGFVQHFGVGIALARKALEENGNPPPEFDVQANHLLVTVRRAS